MYVKIVKRKSTVLNLTDDFLIFRYGWKMRYKNVSDKNKKVMQKMLQIGPSKSISNIIFKSKAIIRTNNCSPLIFNDFIDLYRIINNF